VDRRAGLDDVEKRKLLTLAGLELRSLGCPASSQSWGLGPDFYYCQSVAGLLMWGALSDERKGLSFTVAAGRRQPSHSRVRVPWDS
jgi:hypothetical protein